MLKLKQDPFIALRNPEYRFLFSGRFLFVMGLRMMGTLLGWWVYELTSSPFAIGLIGLAEVIPAVSLALFSGHYIDISEKRKVLLSGVGLYTTIAILLQLTIIAQRHQLANNHIISYFIYALVFLTGIIRSFTGPVFNVMIGNISSDKKVYQNATTWSQSTWLSASVIGHALSGILIATINIEGTLLVIIGLMIVAFFIFTQLLPKPALVQKKEKKTWDSVKEGLAFVFKTKELLAALSLDLFAVLFGGVVAMVPVFAKDILKIGAKGFGYLNSATDLGAICIVIMLTLFPLKQKQGLKLLLSVAGFGLLIIVFAYSTLFWLSFAALMLAGMLDGVSVVIRGTIMQLKTPDYMRGRVMSVNSMFINSSNELGQFESGFAARIMGVIPSVVFGGCMTLLVVGITWFKAPSLRKMEY